MRHALRGFVLLGLVTGATASRLDAVNLNLGVSGVPGVPDFEFLPGGSFTMGDETPGSFNDFQIDSSDGAGDSPGLTGDLDGTFQIGTVSSTVIAPGLILQFAPVTGSGSMAIRDGAGVVLSADLAWNDVTTISNNFTVNTQAVVNLNNIVYAGTNADLLQLAGAGMAILQFNGILIQAGGQNLAQLKSIGGATDNLSGNLRIGCGHLGDFVWHDLDCDGVQDAGEPGIEGVTVVLRNGAGNILATTTTDADGIYEFSGLFDGDYIVDVDESTLPPGFVPTDANQGSDDADSDSAGGAAVAVNLPTSDSVDLTIDFGFVRPGSIGDRVWIESVACDGVEQAGEPGINGVRVELRRASDMALLDATVTSGDGNYTFSGLDSGDCQPPGGYLVVIDLTSIALAGLTAGFDVDGGADARTVVLLPSGAQITDVDFSFCEVFTGLIGDFVWTDLDCDGVQDVGEPGIAGVTVKLLDGAGNVLATTVTDGAGVYLFSDLLPGEYCVMVDVATLPEQLLAGFDLDGGMDSMACVTLARNESRRDVDFGYCCNGRIGDFVWSDLNCDGRQDTGEPGISDVEVLLKDAGGNVIATATTDADGLYELSPLCAGSYTVEIRASTLPAGLVPTVSGAGDAAGDSNSSPAAVTLARNDAEDLTIDFGFKMIGSIGDRVWLDLDCDGRQDAGEPGIAGVRVLLQSADGSILIATVVTGANGIYSFANLDSGACQPNGGYRVVVDTTAAGLAGLLAGFDLDGGQDARSQVNLGSGVDRTDVDFGFCCNARVGDFIWRDLDCDGLQDAGEPGIGGVEVVLKDAGGNVVAVATTNASGIYEFSGLCAGSYTVEVNAATLPAGLRPTLSNAGDAALDSNGSPAAVTLAAGVAEDLTIDFGFKALGSLGDRVWLDLDCDGTQDVGEPGIAGVQVFLRSGNGSVLIATTVTGANGVYSFPNLDSGACQPAGGYLVVVDTGSAPLAGHTAGFDVDGGADARSCVGLGTGQNRTDVDFGFCPPPASGGEGCTPGYWKQCQHFDSWPAPYTPHTRFSAVFDNAFPGKTLLQVLSTGGGGLKALGRHTVAALLSSASPGVDYALSTSDVISRFNSAFPGSVADYEALKNYFAAFNELGCPLN